MSLKGYNATGFARVLEGAAGLIERAAKLYREIGEYGCPPVVAAAKEKEIKVCLCEAEELIAQVRKETGL